MLFGSQKVFDFGEETVWKEPPNARCQFLAEQVERVEKAGIDVGECRWPPDRLWVPFSPIFRHNTADGSLSPFLGRNIHLRDTCTEQASHQLGNDVAFLSALKGALLRCLGRDNWVRAGRPSQPSRCKIVFCLEEMEVRVYFYEIEKLVFEHPMFWGLFYENHPRKVSEVFFNGAKMNWPFWLHTTSWSNISGADVSAFFLNLLNKVRYCLKCVHCSLCMTKCVKCVRHEKLFTEGIVWHPQAEVSEMSKTVWVVEL